MAVSDGDGAIHNHGEGELLLRTPSLMTGYYKRRTLTASAMSDSWYKTGDMGRVDKNGVIWITGRKAHEINRAGVKIQPEEVDAVLQNHPAVGEACTFGLPDAISGEAVAVAVCPRGDSPIDIQSLRSWCLERLRPQWVPERWFVLEILPKTDRGKVDRRYIMQQCVDMEIEQ